VMMISSVAKSVYLVQRLRGGLLRDGAPAMHQRRTNAVLATHHPRA